VGPWDPNWRPDPTGRRLAGIRAARRGALASSVIFGTLVVVGTLVAPMIESSGFAAGQLTAVVIALFSVPGLALLGAGLTAAALGPRSSAAAAGLAMGVGVPVAAVISAMIGAFFLIWIADGAGQGLDVAGQILRGGVTVATGIWPLIALGSAAWVLVVRRLEPPG
jgi:hypothetical protein